MVFRRRIALILAFVAAVVTARTWIRKESRPDPRFARHWVAEIAVAVTAPLEDSAEHEPLAAKPLNEVRKVSVEFQMYPDGSMPGWRTMYSTLGIFPGADRWWCVRGDRLTITTQFSPCRQNANWKERLTYYCERAIHQYGQPHSTEYARMEVRYQILSVQPNRIELAELDSTSGHPCRQLTLIPYEEGDPQ